VYFDSGTYARIAQWSRILGFTKSAVCNAAVHLSAATIDELTRQKLEGKNSDVAGVQRRDSSPLVDELFEVDENARQLSLDLSPSAKK